MVRASPQAVGPRAMKAFKVGCREGGRGASGRGLMGGEGGEEEGTKIDRAGCRGGRVVTSCRRHACTAQARHVQQGLGVASGLYRLYAVPVYLGAAATPGGGWGATRQACWALLHALLPWRPNSMGEYLFKHAAAAGHDRSSEESSPVESPQVQDLIADGHPGPWPRILPRAEHPIRKVLYREVA